MQKIYCCVIERAYAERVFQEHPDGVERLFKLFDKAPAPISVIHETSKDDIEKLGYCMGLTLNTKELQGSPDCFVFATSGNVYHHSYKNRPEITLVALTMDKNEDKDYYTRILEHILDVIDAEYDKEYEVNMQIRGIKDEK